MKADTLPTSELIFAPNQQCFHSQDNSTQEPYVYREDSEPEVALRQIIVAKLREEGNPDFAINDSLYSDFSSKLRELIIDCGKQLNMCPSTVSASL